MTLTKTLSLSLVALCAVAGPALEQDNYPVRQVDYIIPFGPGGESDITARLQQLYFKDKFG